MERPGETVFDENAIMEAGFDRNVWTVGAIYAALLGLGVACYAAIGVRLLRRPLDWAARSVRLRQRPWSLFDGGAIAVILLNLQLLVLVLHGLLGDVVPFFWLVVDSVAFHVAGIGLVVLFLRVRRVAWSDAFGLQAAGLGRRIAQGVGFYLAVLPLLFVSALFYQALLAYLKYPTSLQDIAFVIEESETVGRQVYIFFVAVLVAPFFEELLFRGIGLPLLARKLGAGPAIFLVSAAFAAIHFHVPSLVPLFVLSVAFCLAYLYTGSILVPIVMHGTFNGVNLAMLMLMKN